MNDTVKNIHQKAIKCYRDRQFEDAIALWEKALQINPQEIEVLYSLGLIYFEIKKYDQSIAFLENLLDLSPGHFKAMLIIGTAYIKSRQFDLAEEYIQKSLSINPKHKLSFLNLGAIYSVQKRFDEAIEMFSKVIQLYPSEVRGFLGLAKIFVLQENVDQANKFFKKVIELDGNGPMGSYAKKAIVVKEDSPVHSDGDLEQIYAEGYNFYIAGYYNAAIERFTKYLRSRKKDDLVHFMMAESQLRSGKLSDAFLSFKRAILNKPKNALYYKELAVLLDKMGKPGDVLAILKKAEDLGKSDTVVKYLKGKSYARQNQDDKAVASLKNAIKLNNNNIAARFELAKIYTKMNDFGSAQQQIQLILSHPIDNPIKAQASALASKSNIVI